ncbi:MAG TPA: hypothetical protein VIY72_01235 [Acidimicrobiales bacterium]
MSENDAPIDDTTALEVVGLTPEGLPGVGPEALRGARDEAVSIETGLSFLRRKVQTPLDVVRSELEQRANGHTSDLASLVEDLPRLLSEHSGPGGGRQPQTLEPTQVDPELSAELDLLTDGGMRVALLPTSSDEELVELAGSLDTLERKVSRRRRVLHRTIDLLNGELAHRYGSGEVTVDGALADSSHESD